MASRSRVEDEVLTIQELRAFLKLKGDRKERTWYRVRPFFAPALRTFGGHHRVYLLAKVRAILEAKHDRRSPVSRSRHLRKVE